MDILGETRIDFVGKRRITFVLSAALVLVGLLAAVQVGRGRANLGIDFAGGVSMALRFEHPVSLEQARRVVRQSPFPDSELLQFSEGNRLSIHIKTAREDLEPVSKAMVEALRKGFPDNPFQVEGITTIGPTVGARLKLDALKATIIALVLIVIYIAIRFEWKFGVAATIATFHDVLAVLGIFYLLNKEINLLIVTALLTLAGYSLTDTVVVFDRIRENLRLRAKQSLPDLVNRSINEVLRRTIVTTLTVILVLIPIILYGGEVTHDFALALLLGVIVGTYSSVYLASPLVVVWKTRERKV